MRLDKYLKVSRLIKRRTVAKEMVDAGRVKINDKVAKPGTEVKVGDVLEIGFGRVVEASPDEHDAIEEAVAHACTVADIVVLNAGSSKGSDDWSCEVLEEMGEVICHQTNHGPGHHSSYAMVGGTPIVGISGPAGGASFTLNFYLRPVMRAFLGLDPAPERIPARLAAPFASNPFHKPVDAQKLPGEQRPPEANEPGAVFYSIRFLTLEAAPDGTLAATPLPGRPGTPQTAHANAYYMMPSGPGAETPQVGDVIYVELR